MWGDIAEARESLSTFFGQWTRHAFLCEGGNTVRTPLAALSVLTNAIHLGFNIYTHRCQESPPQYGYPLRPELAESIYHVYKATEDPLYLDYAAAILESIESRALVDGGVASVANVEDHSLLDLMESFFLSGVCLYVCLCMRCLLW